MEDEERTGGWNNGNYKKIHEDLSDDEQPCSAQEQRQVFVSVARQGPRVNNKVLAVCLAALALVLLVVDIGLGVYYNKLTTGQRTIRDISAELTKLQASRTSALQRRDDAKRELALELNDQALQRLSMQHQLRREKDYKELLDKTHLEIVALKSHMPMLEEGCRRCLPGWTFISPMCYYLPFSDTIVRRTWQEGRQFCQRYGSDLLVVDSTEKHLAISELINHYKDPSRPVSYSGFWIGLRDVEVEGTWRWVDGRRLGSAFWNDGEPNDSMNEDCAATYPRLNPFKAWNDAPCNHHLKWICEMRGKSIEM